MNSSAQLTNKKLNNLLMLSLCNISCINSYKINIILDDIFHLLYPLHNFYYPQSIKIEHLSYNKNTLIKCNEWWEELNSLYLKLTLPISYWRALYVTKNVDSIYKDLDFNYKITQINQQGETWERYFKYYYNQLCQQQKKK